MIDYEYESVPGVLSSNQTSFQISVQVEPEVPYMSTMEMSSVKTFSLVLHPAHHGTTTRSAADTGVCPPVSRVVPERGQRIGSAPCTARYVDPKASSQACW